MLSESVYNFAAASRRSATAEQDSDSQQYEPHQGAQLQLAANVQQQQQVPVASGGGKPRNKRKNFKPINSRMAEVSDESGEEVEAPGAGPEEPEESELLEGYERKSLMLQASDSRTSAQLKQRLNNNEVIPMDLSVATRPPSSEGDDDSADSFRHKFILEQLRSQKFYSPGGDVSISF